MFFLSCSRAPASTICKGSTSIALGVAWPGVVDSIDSGDIELKRKVFAQARALTKDQRTEFSSALQLTRLAAGVGDVNLAVEASRAGLALKSEDSEARSAVAAALLARFNQSGSINDLLDASEILAAGNLDTSGLCNRQLALHHLGLRYRMSGAETDCPCLSDMNFPLKPQARFPLDGHRYSADHLKVSELEEVEALLAGGDRVHAKKAIRRSSQAWRVWFEHGALELWRSAENEVASRAIEKRVALLAATYAEATSNPAPVHLWDQITGIPQPHAWRLKRSLLHWKDGSGALASYEPDRVESELSLARGEIAARLPALLPSVDLALATARYYLGDSRGMLERASSVRHGVSREIHPWAWARALWLEALALQATADWSESLRRADQAGQIYTKIGEPANAGYQEVVRGVALESQGAEEAASSAYLNAVTRIHEAGDTRLLAGAFALFARLQSRVGRPHLAVELQKESTMLESVSTPQLVAETRAILAEQLFHAGEDAEGWRVLEQAKAAAEGISSAQPRRRADAILAQVEALGIRAVDPIAAEAALSHFLSEFDSFGEKFYRIEALIDRAELRLLLGKLPAAEQDLAAALDEISSQGERLEDRVQSVVLLDRTREVLDLLLAVLLRRPNGEVEALDWIESLRAEQIGLGFGSENVSMRRHKLTKAPRGTCITEFWATPMELLVWTSCNGGAPRLDRIKVPKDDLLRELAKFRRISQRGNLRDIRKQSVLISQWLVAPISELLSKSHSWSVVPDALFPAIPFAWLTLNGRFVFEDRTVQMAPSWASLAERQSRPATPWKVLAVGDPDPGADSIAASLPFARAEVGRISALFPGPASRIGAQATWTSLLQQRGSFNVLHLAVHASSGSRVPLSARLELAAEPTRPDGRVSADEISKNQFPGLRLAVVASCSSATATPTRVAGTLDFGHAFLRAGADDAIGTLWDVPDRETAMIISEFYNELRAGLGPSQALRHVWQKSLRGPSGSALLNVRAALQLSSSYV